MSKLTMSEAIALHNELATAQGKETVTTFKNLSAASKAIVALGRAAAGEDETSGAPGLDTPTPSGDKYNSSAKRGPTQGIGAFSKGLIAEGKTNAEILAAIAEQFPTAKTTANCIAYYRAKMAKAATAPVAEEPPVAEEATV